MFHLFASAQDAATETVVHHGMLPPDFWQGVMGTGIYFAIAMLLFFAAYKVVDWITPGDLDKQLLGTEGGDGKPNIALGIVVAGMFVAIGMIIAAAIK